MKTLTKNHRYRLPQRLALPAPQPLPFAADRQTTSVDVSLEGIDLSTEAGQKELERKIERAVRARMPHHPR